MAIDMNRLTSGVDLPTSVAGEVIRLTAENSTIMAASKKITLPGRGTTIPVMTGNASAGWVGETDEIKVSRPSFGAKDMTSYKMGVIVPFSREFIRDAKALYDAAIALLPSALALLFDQTVAGITAAPGSNFDTLAGAPSAVLKADTAGTDILGAVTALAKTNAQISHWIASPLAHAAYLGALDVHGRPLFVPNMDKQNVGSLYGSPVLRVSETLVPGAEEDDASVIGMAGDFGTATVGQVEAVTLRVADQATIQDGDKSLNLFQRDMIAVRATAEVGFRVEDVNKFIRFTDK